MNTVCNMQECTMCGACQNICPENCLSPRYDGNCWYMVRDEQQCSQCGLCRRVCPNHNMVLQQKPRHAYAAWNMDPVMRKQSASGGIGAALYEYAKKKDMYFAGVLLNENFEAHYVLTDDLSYRKEFQNSKYTFSYVDGLYREIREKLREGKGVLFIGLPCQAAALKSYLTATKTDTDHLILVDLICHGTPHPSFLKDHIAAIREKTKIPYHKCYFRDPRFHTGNFVFTLYDNRSQEPVYKKIVQSNDLFQIGYHKAWIYRQCCYQCHYARSERTGDLTIGDYHGLGKMADYTGEYENVSVILADTESGQKILEELVSEKFIMLHERPIEEPIAYEPQLSHPSIGGEIQKRFVREYEKTQDFERAAGSAFGNERIKNQLKLLSKKVLPEFMITYIKNKRSKMRRSEG